MPAGDKHDRPEAIRPDPPLSADRPPLAYRARLDELDGCWLELRCGDCGRITTPAIKMLIGRLGGRHQLGAVVQRLVCQKCRTRPAEIHLNETHNREHCYGSPPGWSVKLWPLE